MQVQHSHEHTYSNKPQEEPHVHGNFCLLERANLSHLQAKNNVKQTMKGKLGTHLPAVL